MREVSESNDIEKPTPLSLNKDHYKNISTKKDGAYFCFETDSSLYPYTFDVNFYSTTGRDALTIRIYEIGKTDYVGYNTLKLNSTWKETYVFKSNKKYIITAKETYGANIFDKTDQYLKFRINIKHEGVFKHNGKWTYFNSDGEPDYSFTGVVQTTNGNWVFVKKGIFDTSFTGVARSTTGNWVFVKNGRFTSSYTGVAKRTTGRWVYVKKGRFSKEAQKATGVATSTTGNNVYVSNGRYSSKYTGLAKSLNTGDL